MIIKTKYAGQKYSKEYPSEYPGVATVTVTAPDEVSTDDYLFNIALYPDALDENVHGQDIRVVNPAVGNISIINSGEKSGFASFTVYDLNGRLIMNDDHLELKEGICVTGLDANALSAGTYIYHLQIENQVYSGKLTRLP
jgi:hypothetical protein